MKRHWKRRRTDLQATWHGRLAAVRNRVEILRHRVVPIAEAIGPSFNFMHVLTELSRLMVLEAGIEV